ncbi:CUB and sushi domain-containing protein 3-like [Ciona intestinalis]
MLKSSFSTVVQCPVPIPPPRMYVDGGRWNEDGSRHFRYSDVASVSCAHGYYLQDMLALSTNLVCTEYGNWSKNIDKFNCIDITCQDPGEKLYSVREGSGTTYLSRITYKCHHGYFIKPGIVKLTLQCSYEQAWSPPATFQCKVVDCEDPGYIHHASKVNATDLYIFPMGTHVQYMCEPEHYVAFEQDAVGHWVAGERKEYEKTLVCQYNGWWNPQPHTLQCSERAIATTLRDLVRFGQLVDVTSKTEMLRDKNFVESIASGRLQLTEEMIPSVNNYQYLDTGAVDQVFDMEPQASLQISGKHGSVDHQTNHHVGKDDHHTEIWDHCQNNKVTNIC